MRTGGLLLDPPVHDRLREGWLVALVVAVPPVAVHVDDDVALELRAEVHRERDGLSDALGILAVDVEYRRVEGCALCRSRTGWSATARVAW